MPERFERWLKTEIPVRRLGLFSLLFMAGSFTYRGVLGTVLFVLWIVFMGWNAILNYEVRKEQRRQKQAAGGRS